MENKYVIITAGSKQILVCCHIEENNVKVTFFTE